MGLSGSLEFGPSMLVVCLCGLTLELLCDGAKANFLGFPLGVLQSIG
jgi:hypothetical protein